MSSSRKRRQAILSLVAGRSIGTQEELVTALDEQGVEASQASVSRDVAALGLVKVGGRWVAPPPATVTSNPLEDRIAAWLLSVEPAGDHMVVLKTPPGEASGVALALDRLAMEGVVGTIAGDDTIFVAVENAAACDSVSTRLQVLQRDLGED
jgi:transcriptional regulator of arginine metabolism